ncbi:heparan-alpha-glucosaminide N-acetyltransferase domain-containing protein [Nocardioides sp. SOB44]|uniref:Heparan-alpha-glucosaminide N-acetyltransferase domain-containing protein n=1 Tax=Nocardioides cremeus TaxID=3058044 RepID=A0ABT8TPE4_9ACTN|nr:heparan-alpha-glucosaminide N-acetyltransferase domain-containing protein [Nocardioides cremeus]MDO3395711.1 heparan-alpha-glucosaminide N-acetyltransferase domain-containing protein [Nocardioides cremeus]
MVRPGRLVGIDLARCLALLAMMATHLLDERDPDGTLSASAWLFSGRASALFALLAGVSLALMSGRTRPLRGRARARRSAGLAVRALLVALVGLALGEVDSGIAVILTHYGLLLLMGLLVLGLGARALAVLAAVWVVLGPVVAQVLRPELPPRGFASPSFEQLAEPGRLLSELLFTGYYPMASWFAYLLAGMALGRLDLAGLRRRVLAALALAGGALALATTWLSHRLTEREDVLSALLPGVTARRGPEVAASRLREQVEGGLFGQTPVEGPWQWLLVVAPHSTTPFDLAQTIGSAVLVVALCLLLVRLLPGPTVDGVAVAAGAGAATLSLYSLHVLMTTEAVWPSESSDGTAVQYVVVLGLGALLAATGRRGPLEAAVARLSDGATR